MLLTSSAFQGLRRSADGRANSVGSRSSGGWTGLLREPDDATPEDIDCSVRTALDQLGPIGLTVSAGKGGGGAGVRGPRRPRPFAGSGATELPVPADNGDERVRELAGAGAQH